MKPSSLSRSSSAAAAALAVAAACSGAPAVAAPLSLDEFTFEQNFSSCNFPGFSVVSADTVLSRRLLVAGCSRFPFGGGATIGAGEAKLYGSFGGSVAGIGMSYHSAIFDLPNPPGPAVDLTQGGSLDTLWLRIKAPRDATVGITVSSGANSSSYQTTLAQGADFVDLYLPLASFSVGADFSAVTRLGLNFTDPTPDTDTAFGTVSRIEVELDHIRMVPEPGAWALMALGLAVLGLRQRVSRLSRMASSGT